MFSKISLEAVVYSLLKNKIGFTAFEGAINEIPRLQQEEICNALIGFSKNLVDIVTNDDRYESVKEILGTHDNLISEKTWPFAYFLNSFEYNYIKGNRKSILLKYHKDTVEAASTACNVPDEFIDAVKGIGMPGAAFVLTSCKNKYLANG